MSIPPNARPRFRITSPQLIGKIGIRPVMTFTGPRMSFRPRIPPSVNVFRPLLIADTFKPRGGSISVRPRAILASPQAAKPDSNATDVSSFSSTSSSSSSCTQIEDSIANFGVAAAKPKGEGHGERGGRNRGGAHAPLLDSLFTRPQTCVSKMGETGRHVTLDTNYFKILKKPEWNIYQYRVDFVPEIDMSFVRRTLIAQQKAKFGGYIFDGTMLFTTNDLRGTKKGHEFHLTSEYHDGKTVLINFKNVGIVDPNEAQLFQVLNLILRQSMVGLDLQRIAHNFFDPYAKMNIDPCHIEIWPGYITSIRQHERDILLCAEITHKIMRIESLYSILRQLTVETKDYQKAFKTEVIGSIVLTDYNNKTYRITDVDFASSPLSTFSLKDTKVSFAEYFKSRYNLIVTDSSQPMLISKPTNKHIRGGQEEFISLIPEFTRATGITDHMRTNVRFMKSMSDHTRLNPERRLERLRNFNERLNSSAKTRILPCEKILLGRGVRYICDGKANWTREFRNCSMFCNAKISRWQVILPSRYCRETQSFVQMCIKVAKNMSLVLVPPKYIEMDDDRNKSYTTAVEMASSEDPQILMIVIQQPNEEKYSVIKKKCCIDRPIASQVVTMKMIAPTSGKSAGLMSIATKVVIQMNAKLRGIPWMIDLPLKGLMTVGFDVCHSSKDKNTSYSALVATMDVRCSSRYFSAVSKHQKFQELSNDIILHFTFALRAYAKEHGTLPERILFYRDGVGDGQLHQVVNTELNHLRIKAQEIYEAAGKHEIVPRFAFIVVSKRLNTRLFINNCNPPPGTVVDDIITLPERYDFFIVSQSVRQGTVSPTSYNVIYDTMGLTPDRIQMLTYKMTHMYYNYTGTCRVPAVCQYAHKLAYLVAESIHCPPSQLHEKNLYFL
ncbi:protein aubergine-like isoform X2 [Teleopsis dalmanni]|uniref:protein aubergine-like isoform X2 n=2 Tax=Teleopsis dalmanni TaxID=139649 RepID=UPI0018CCDE6F|nr:protein aubergine-like isoform X2 [Teleopsis dalmanni]XP_037960573.1 protein aubergine-like isoform X2 [Teleopsis dalmanni]